MNINIPLERGQRPFRSELRVVVGTTGDVAVERAILNERVLPTIRARAQDAGVLLRESDPRFEAMLEPDRAREIVAEHVELIRGYHPVLIVVVGAVSGPAGARRAAAAAEHPWLADIAADPGVDVAREVIDCALGDALMRDRAFFYRLASEGSESSGEEHSSGAKETPAALIRRAREAGCRVREGISDPETLARRIRADLLGALETLGPRSGGGSGLEHERRLHEEFARSHRRAYFPIDSYLNALDDHLAGRERILLVTGASGGGKSALLANWVAEVRDRFPELPIISHYVGAVSSDEGSATVLRHLLAELEEICGIEEEIPADAEGLAAALPLWLARVRHERLLIVIDGLNRIDDGAAEPKWLPPRVPANVTLIVSATSPGPMAERLLKRKWSMLELEPLTAEQSLGIVDCLVRESEIVPGPMISGLPSGGVPSAVTPFFLRAREHGARLFGGSGKRMKLPDAGTTEDLMLSLLEKYEHRHGRELVRDLLSLLHCAHAGLFRDELEDLAAADGPAVNEFLDAFDFHLMKRGGLLTFVHEQVRLAAARRYRIDGKRAAGLHGRLARYFGSLPISSRRADEEPWQWLRSGDRERLTACLADMEILLAFSDLGRGHELRAYWVSLNDDATMIDRYRESFERWKKAHPDSAERASAAERLGRFFAVSGLWEGAEEYLRYALDLKRGIHGEAAAEVADTMWELGEILRSAGAFDRAEEMYRGALEIRERLLAPDDPAIAQAVSDLGLLNRDRGRLVEALPLYLRALELRRRAYGENHPATAESLNNLAVLYSDLKKHELAIPLFRHALEIRRHRYGDDHPAVATLHNNLAVACCDMGDFDAAEQHFSAALEIRERLLGPAHQHTLESISNLATVLFDRKDYDGARAMFERAVAVAAEAIGREHPDAIALAINQARVLRMVDDHRAAEVLLRNTLETAAAALGENHLHTAACANNLARTLHETGGSLEEAATLYERAIAGWEASCGADFPFVGDALHLLGTIRIETGETAVAGELLRRALEIRRRHYGPEHQRTIRTGELLASIERAGPAFR